MFVRRMLPSGLAVAMLMIAGTLCADDPPATDTGAPVPSSNEAIHDDHGADNHGADNHGADDHSAAGHDDGGHGHHDGTDLGHANAGAELHAAQEWKADLAIYTLVVFLLLFLLLAKFAWKPISEGLAKREQAIADNISAAEQALQDAHQLTAKYEAQLAGAADEVRQMIEEARRDADHTRQEIIAEAKASAEAESNRAVREINTAKDGALKELATLAANQAVELAGQVVSTKLTPEEQSGLIQTALDNLPNPSNN